MGNYYSPLFGELNSGSRVVHPETGEVYGGTDWDNPGKRHEPSYNHDSIITTPI